MRLLSAAVPGLLCVVLLSGCMGSGENLDTEEHMENEAESDPYIVEWSPPTDARDAVYMFRATAGPDTECTSVMQQAGNSNLASSRLFSYSMFFNDTLEDTSIRAVIHGDESSFHAGPVHSNTYVQETREAVLDQVVTAEWMSKLGAKPFSNATRGSLEAGFGARLDPEFLPTLEVECDDKNVHIEIYRADAYSPINSGTSEGGIGFHSVPPGGLGGVSVNEGDTYSITTEGDVVVFDVVEHPGSFVGVDPFVDGTIQIRAPAGEETVNYELGDEEYAWIHQEVWREPGTYEIELDRHAVGYGSLKGILAGFVLTEEFGELEVPE